MIDSEVKNKKEKIKERKGGKSNEKKNIISIVDIGSNDDFNLGI